MDHKKQLTSGRAAKFGRNVLPVRNFILISAFSFDVVVFGVVTFPTEWNG